MKHHRLPRAALLVVLTAPFASPFQRPGAGGSGSAGQGKVLPADAVPQEQGTPGTQYPIVGSVVRPDAPIHEDTTGTASRDLLDVAGAAGGGFAAIWQDGRAGNMGLAYARIGLDGSAREEERAPYTRARTSRELDPSIAVNAAGAAVMSWREKSMTNGYFFTRLVDAQGEPSPQHLPMGFELPESDARGRGAALVQPSVAVLPDGSGACVWLAEQRAMLQVIHAAGPRVDQPQEVSRKEKPATARPVVGAATDGTLLVAWATRAGIESIERPLRGPDERNALGAGAPLEIHADGRGGWWLFVEHDGRRALRHVSSHGKIEAELGLPAGTEGEWIDVAVADWGVLALLSSSGGRAGERDSQHRVAFLSASDGKPLREPLVLRSETGTPAGSARLAASGAVGLIAWRERRGGEAVIAARTIDAQGAFGPVRDLTHDHGTANQNAPDLASNGVDLAICAWVDYRNGGGEVWARTVDAAGEFASGEFVLPAPLAGEPSPDENQKGGSPAVAMAPDSRFAVAWLAAAEGTGTLMVQGFGADAKPLGAAVPHDGGLRMISEPDLVSTPEGYVVFWSHPRNGLSARRTDFAGRPLGEAASISADASADSVSACRLDAAPRERDAGDLAVAWDVGVPGVGRRLRARVLGARLELRGRELGFDTMYQGSDWDPAIAPLADGGFALIWITGETRSRDVFARGFDADGKPRSRPYAVSVRANEQDAPEITRLADGSLLLAWEDDIANWDYVNVRRLSGDLKTLGPTMQICERPPDEFLRVHTRAKIAPFGDGFVAVWGDARRSRGFDVFWKVVGPGFDARPGARK